MVGPPAQCAAAQAVVHRVIPSVLGRGAVSAKKSFPPAPVRTVLGWDCDFPRELMFPSAKLLRKARFSFWVVDPKQKHPLSVIEVLAGLAEHLSQGVRGMRPFVAPLHHLKHKFNGVRSLAVRHAFDAPAKLALEMWRAVTITLFAQADGLAVPFSAFTRHLADSATCLGISDGSPVKVGAALFSRNCALLAWARVRILFADPKGIFQNVREYLGFISTLLLALSCANTSLENPARVAYIGDNKAALSWADKEKTKSSVCQLANITSSWLGIHSAVEVAQVRHLSASRIGLVDSITRDLHHNFPPELEVDLSSNPHFMELFALLDPTRDSSILIDHREAVARVVGVLRKVVDSIPRTVHLPDPSAEPHRPEFSFQASEEIAVPSLEEGIFRGLEPILRPVEIFGSGADAPPPG